MSVEHPILLPTKTRCKQNKPPDTLRMAYGFFSSLPLAIFRYLYKSDMVNYTRS